MRKRTKARELALKIFYQADINRQEPVINALDSRADLENIDPAVLGFCNLLVTGTSGQLKEIDKVITQYTTNWQLERMAVIDRNILRIATFELLFLEDIPPKVSINEAVELAKKYGDIDSGKFVNGILDKINKTIIDKCKKNT